MAEKKEIRANQGSSVREYFGVGPIVAIILWESLYLHDLIPEGGQLIHLLWTLCFLKEYGKTHQMANQAKVDAKTYRKYVWRFIVAISDLEVHVVRFFMIYCHIIVYFLFLNFFFRLYFLTGMLKTKATIAW